jgi:hypothetical protein
MPSMFLILGVSDYPDKLNEVIELMRHHELGDPLIFRAQSAAAALSVNVPAFSGIRGLLGPTNEDRLMFVSPFSGDQQTLSSKLESIHKSLDAEPPPIARFFAIPLATPKTS